MQSLLYGLFSESPWNSESVQIPYKIINDSLWAKLTCFPYNNIYYMLSLHIGGGCGQINLNYEHKPSYLIFYILTDEIETGVCVRLCEWRQQRAPPWMNEHREGCNSSQPLRFCSTAVRELKVNIWDRRMRLEMSVFLSSCNALFYSWINFLRVPGHLIAITYSIISVTVSRTKLYCSN